MVRSLSPGSELREFGLLWLPSNKPTLSGKLRQNHITTNAGQELRITKFLKNVHI